MFLSIRFLLHGASASKVIVQVVVRLGPHLVVSERVIEYMQEVIDSFSFRRSPILDQGYYKGPCICSIFDVHQLS